MPLDTTGTLLAGIRTAVLSRATFLPRNVIVTTLREWRNALGTRTLPNDFPCVLIFASGDGQVSSPVRSFGIGTQDHNYPKRFTIRVEVRVVFDKQYDSATLPTEALISAGLIATDETLRDSALRPAPLDWVRSRTVETFNGAQRTVVIWTTTADCRPYYQDLIS